MRTVSLVATAMLLVSSVYAVAQPPREVGVSGEHRRICLNTRQIVSSKSRDGRTMLFQMRDGRQYLNHLRGYCPGLKFDGFSWVLRSGDEEVCENAQSLRVLRSGEVCILGRFEPVRGPNQ
jgi:hypothetical protein